MLSLQSDPRQYNLNLQPVQRQQQVARVPYNVVTDHHRDDSSLSFTSGINIKQEHSSEVDGDMLLNAAHQNYKAGNYKQALERSKAVYERNPRRADNLLLLGAIYYQLHEFELCIAKNEEALRIDRNFAECYGNMANAWKEKGNIDVAIRYYLIAIELRPNFADAWSNLASAYMRKGRLNEAAQCCRQALALNPHLVDAHSNLGNLMKAQGLVQENATSDIHIGALKMRNKNRTKAEPTISRVAENPVVPLQPQFCFDGENLATLLKSFQREIESARALDTALPLKFWIKQQFSVGVNEVTRSLERMPPHRMTEIPSEFPLTKLDSSRTHSVHLQAILLASDCNPRWLTKHLPALAASKNVPLILIKDSKRGSLRLGELIKLKTAIAIGVKAKGNNVNQLIKDILLGDKIHDRIEKLHHTS